MISFEERPLDIEFEERPIVDSAGPTVEYDEQLDPDLFFDARKTALLDEIGMEFGGRTSIGRGTEGLFRGIKNMFLPDDQEDTDEKRIENDLRSIPEELRNTPQGQAYEQDMRGRIAAVLDSDSMATGDAVRMFVDSVYNAPGETLELLAQSIIEDPVLAVTMAMGYGAASKVTGGATKLNRLLYTLSNGTAKQRAAAKTLKTAIDTATVAGTEATVGGMYQAAHNKALGADPMHNVEAMAALSAVLGGSAKFLSSAFKSVNGYGGSYRTADEAVKALAEHHGLTRQETVEYILANIYENIPMYGASAERINLILRDIEEAGIRASNPELHKAKLKTELKDVVARAIKDDPDTFYAEVKKSHNPIASKPSENKVYYNKEQMARDFEDQMAWLQGKTREGLRMKGEDAQARRMAFEDFDFAEFQKWIARKGGTTAYSDFLIRKQRAFNKAVNKKPNLAKVDAHRISAMRAIEEMGKTIGDFKKRGPIESTLSTAGNVAWKATKKYAAEPDRLIAPIIDIVRTPFEFAKSITGIIKNPKEYNQARLAIEDLLRDWEGATHTLDIKARQVQDWIETEFPNLEQRTALSHYMEGDLARYNDRRVRDGLSRIKFNARQQNAAKVIRKLLTQTRKAVNERSGKRNELNYRPNYFPRIVREKSGLPTEQEIMDALFADQQRGLNLHSTHSKKRQYDTILDAEDAGFKMHTKDAAKVVGSYIKSIQRAELNKDLLRNLKELEAPSGAKLLTTRDKAPKGYVEFKHSSFKDSNGNNLWVNPNIAPDLRLYFDTSNPTIIRRVLTNVIQTAKRLVLTASGFHVVALAWSAMMTGMSPGQIAKNMVPLQKIFPASRSVGHRATLGGEGHEYMQVLMRNGLQVGLAEELRGDALINALNRTSEFAESFLQQNKYSKAFGRVLTSPIRGFAKLQSGIDNYLWDQVATGLKSTTALTQLERLITQDARRFNEGKQSSLTDLNVLAQSAARFANDAYGNQNWAQMAMNVESAMGHRIAAALNRPTSREYIRMAIFAPDWSLSNLRVAGKAFMPGKELSRDVYAMYLVRSAIYFAFLAEAIQQMSGQGSIFDDDLADALRPDVGGGKQVELSKQSSEVVRNFIYGPAHVLQHKIGTLPRAVMESNSISEIPLNFAKQAVPIVAKQAYNEGWESAASGAAGVPLYNK